jgi:hypothetical protein
MFTPNEKITREDGLIVYLTADGLNNIKLNGTKEEVIMAVAYNVARKAAINYCERYSPETLSTIKERIPEISQLSGVRKNLIEKFEF